MTDSPTTKPVSPQEFRQHILLTFFTPFGFGIFGLLAIYDYYFLQQYTPGILAGVLSLSFLITNLHYRFTKQLKTGITMVVSSATILLLIFIYQNQNQSFGLVWALLYPPLIIMTIGHYWGVRIALLIYFLLVGILLSGVGIWQQGLWDMTGLIRFSLGYIAMTYLSYILALSNQFSYGLLEKRHREHLGKHKAIEKIATTDSVTGVYNRYYLNQIMHKLPTGELQHSQTNLIFFIAQVDWFKEYVDYYGYEKGDKLLITISQIIQNQMKPVNGLVYRINGSQFAGSILAKDITKALFQIKEIQDLIDKEHIVHFISPYKQVHISIGIAIDNRFSEFNFNELFTKADEALYQSFGTQAMEPRVLDIRTA